MSTVLKSPEGLKDSDCKKRQLSSQPLIPYVPPMDLVTTKEVPEGLKIKLPDGTICNLSIIFQGTPRNALCISLQFYISSTKRDSMCIAGSWSRLPIPLPRPPRHAFYLCLCGRGSLVSAEASASPPKSSTIQCSLLDKFKCNAAPSACQIT
jgi:hypothetical protein